ncbi:MAG: TonB-dependent receptor [Bacteroidales bacterium]|nr:TonB-dependent receptor [Bacteroidales bacterium]
MHNRIHNKRILSLIILCFAWIASPSMLSAQDTTVTNNTKRKVLGTVTVRGDNKTSSTLAKAPVQIVDMEKMERNGDLLLSDAVKHMAGITLRDYGGIGGMKTVSARGLGSQFSTLTIDGIAVNDCQNGQVDLGRYMVGNSSMVSLSNGEQDYMLLSARATAAGSIINMETMAPTFLPGEKTHVRLNMEVGSFGMLSPSLALDRRLGKRLSLSLWGNWLKSDGDYPFTLYYTTSHNDSSSTELRQHSAMWMATGDANLFYNISTSSTLTTKVHYVQGYHQLPGPVIYYSQKGSENTREKLFFAQSKFQCHKENASFQIIGKYQYSYDMYEDSMASSLSRYIMNEYSQNEGYLSGATVWRPSTKISLSAATDAALTTLASNLSQNSHVYRTSSLSTISAQYRHRKIDIKATLLATLVSEKVLDNNNTTHYNKLSPYAGLSFKPFDNNRIRIRYFFKETYRVPNFSEMYFFVAPLDTLRPECATQHNIGVTLPMTEFKGRDTMSHWMMTLTIDGYHNRVKDKIVAVPRQNMFIWSTMNLGLVNITGLDLNYSLDWERGHTAADLSLTYSYQRALDCTDPNNHKTYLNQIPYTPRNSGGISLYIKTHWVNAGYSCTLVGERYSKQQNSDNTRLEAYSDHSITVDRSFDLPIGELRIQAQLLNIFDKQYEVVRSYPMMGRNFRIKVGYYF